MAETAVTLRLEDWSQLLVKLQNAVGLEKADSFIKEADIVLTPKKHPKMITLRWIDFDLSMPDTEVQDRFRMFLESYKYNAISIPDYVEGITENYDYRDEVDDFNWQWPMIVLPTKEAYMRELERILPKVIKLAMDAGVTKEQMLPVFENALDWRESKEEVLDAYIEKSRH